MERTEGIHWLPEDEYQKSVTQLRLQIGAVLQVFNIYGMDVYIPGAQVEIIKLCEAFGLRVRGMDKPISREMIRRERNEGK